MAEEDEDEDEERDRPFYRLVAVRKAAITDPEEYTDAIDALVRELMAKDPARFYFLARTPTHKMVPVIDGAESNVWRFVSTSEIEWNFGRRPQDPTHQVIFVNGHEDESYAMLKVQFFVKPPDDPPGSPPKPDDGPQKCPGILAELNLAMESSGPSANAPPETTRGQHLDELFSMLHGTFKPDHGHIEVPGHPENEKFPMQYDVGWLTYLSKKELPVPPALALPAQVIPTDEGTKLIAVVPLTQQTYPDIAKQVDLVREALRPREIEHVPPPKPPSVPPTRVQRPSYMRDPVTGMPIEPSPSAAPPPASMPAPIVAPPMMAPIPKRESFDYEAPPEHVAMPYVDDRPLENKTGPTSERGPSSAGGLVPQITQELPAMSSEDTQDLDAKELDRMRELQDAATPFRTKDPKKEDDK